MSIVVAARTRDSGIVMACDSQVTDGYIKETADCKIWTDGGALYGAVGDLRTVQVIKYHLPAIRKDDSCDPCDDIVTGLVPILQQLAEERGTLTKSDEGAFTFDAHLLVAYDDVLAMIDSTFAVMIPDTGRAAIGTGRDVALGYLGNDTDWHSSQVIDAARRAVELSVNVSGPVYAVDTKTHLVRIGE